MSNITSETPVKRQRLNRSGWAVLVLALLLVGVSATQAIYRIALPTEGWNYTQGTTTEDFSDNLIIFTDNLLGAPSPLHPGDQLVRLEGVTPPASGSFNTPGLTDGWRAGQTVFYTVIRDNQTIEVPVLLKNWTPGSILNFTAGSPDQWIDWLGAIFISCLALLVLLRRPNEAAARALLLLAATILATHLSGIVPDGPTTTMSLVGPLDAFFSYWSYAFLLGPTFFVMALVFPRPRRSIRRFPWLVVVPYIPVWLLTSIIGTRPEIGYGLTTACFALTLLTAIYSAITLRDAQSRAQLLWALTGLIGVAILFAPTFAVSFGLITPPASRAAPVNQIINALGALPSAFFGICLAIAILRYHLYDIEVIIRRTLIYTALTALLALVYFGGVAVLQTLLRPLTGEGNDLAVVATTLVIAALFLPLRSRVQLFIDRRFYQRKYDAARVLTAFTAYLSDEVELDRLTERLIDVVGETIQPASISLWLREPPGAAAAGHAMKAAKSNIAHPTLTPQKPEDKVGY